MMLNGEIRRVLFFLLFLDEKTHSSGRNSIISERVRSIPQSSDLDGSGRDNGDEGEDGKEDGGGDDHCLEVVGS